MAWVKVFVPNAEGEPEVQQVTAPPVMKWAVDLGVPRWVRDEIKALQNEGTLFGYVQAIGTLLRQEQRSGLYWLPLAKKWLQELPEGALYWLEVFLLDNLIYLEGEKPKLSSVTYTLRVLTLESLCTNRDYLESSLRALTVVGFGKRLKIALEAFDSKMGAYAPMVKEMGANDAPYGSLPKILTHAGSVWWAV